jgi:hypothetical protein
MRGEQSTAFPEIVAARDLIENDCREVPRRGRGDHRFV